MQPHHKPKGVIHNSRCKQSETGCTEITKSTAQLTEGVSVLQIKCHIVVWNLLLSNVGQAPGDDVSQSFCKFLKDSVTLLHPLYTVVGLSVTVCSMSSSLLLFGMNKNVQAFLTGWQVSIYFKPRGGSTRGSWDGYGTFEI